MGLSIASNVIGLDILLTLFKSENNNYFKNIRQVLWPSVVKKLLKNSNV